jgi:hypothetical protein
MEFSLYTKRTREKYFNMDQDFMKIMEDPKPGLELVGKLIETKRKNNAKHFPGSM